MTITIEENAGVTRLRLEGMLDSNSSAEFQTAVDKILEKDSLDVNIDLEKLEYTSSQGLRTILTLIKGANAKGGKLVFRNIRPAVREILDISGISKVMTIE